MDVKKTGKELSRLWFGLAPMEGVTDFATRLWLTQNGAPDFTTTPFLRVTKDYPPKRISANFLPEIQLSKAHGIVTCIPQLMASDEDDLIRIARHFLEQVPFVDINCGCPSPTVVGHGAGSGLLQSPQRFSDYLKKIVEALGPQRVSVKMRVGFSHEDEFAKLIDVVSGLPLARLTIHGRTRSERYTGESRWSLIGQAARSLPFPVVGSGDVTSPATLAEKLALASEVAGVIVGRGALRDPWIFARLRNSQFKLDRDYFRSSLLQFVLLQELQAHHWDALISAVQDRVFAFDKDHEPKGNDSRLMFQMKELEDRTPALFGTDARSVDGWLVGRAGLARGKMLWNYLRSGLDLAPELTVRLLRAPSWLAFLEALDSIVERLPEGDIGLTHRREWDWVFSGAGSGSAGEKRDTES